MKKKLAILGSTGSIGVSTLNVVAQFPARFEVVGLAAQRNIALLEAQIRQFRPSVAAVADEPLGRQLRERCAGLNVEVLTGAAGIVQVATHPAVEWVVSAIVGFAGLVPTYQAVLANKHIALANKETLVAAGELIMPEIARRGLTLLPVDSEHSAIFQALQGQRRADVRQLLLTCSGGPFRQYSPAQLQTVTPQDALRHPNWAMGPKITIDSATLMNKGLEVLETHWLFNVRFTEIQVVIHPQSVIHSLVEYVDGSIIAQLGAPDMRIPIAYALTYPERLPLDAPKLNLCNLGALTFAEPDTAKFPCLQYAYEAGAIGGTMPAVLNAANEIAVAAFLQEQCAFGDIPRTIRQVMAMHEVKPLASLDAAIAADQWGRSAASTFISELKGKQF